MEQQLEELRLLADELNIRDPRKLVAAARRREFRDVNEQLAREALRKDVARQVLAPPPRSTGKSAAEAPNTRLQADLIDFSKNARAASGAKYALLLTDVFTREVAATPLKTKAPSEVNPALQGALGTLVDDKQDIVVTVDAGKEWAQAEEAIGEEGILKQKRPEDRNAIAIVDKATMTIKKDLAGVAAKRGGDWDKNLPGVVSAYNERPHDAVFGPPREVERGDGVQEFLVLKDNAKKFMVNRAQSERRMADVRETKAIRAPTNAARSFEPRYGPVQRVRKVESDMVTLTNGRQVLLKQAQAVPADSGRLQGRLTDPTMVRRSRLQAQADMTEAFIMERGGSITTRDLEQAMKNPAGGLPNIWRDLRRAKLTLAGFLRTFSNMFKVRQGKVTLVNAPAPPQPPAPDPAPEPPEPTLEERLAAAEARREAARLERERKSRERLRFLGAAYGGRG